VGGVGGLEGREECAEVGGDAVTGVLVGAPMDELSDVRVDAISASVALDDCEVAAVAAVAVAVAVAVVMVDGCEATTEVVDGAEVVDDSAVVEFFAVRDDVEAECNGFDGALEVLLAEEEGGEVALADEEPSADAAAGEAETAAGLIAQSHELTV
jgi:hypothetical protein